MLDDMQFPFGQHLVLLSYAEVSLVFSVSDNVEDKPPPLPTQKPVGDLGRPVSASQVRFSWVLYAGFKYYTFANSRRVRDFLKMVKILSYPKNAGQGISSPTLQPASTLRKPTAVSLAPLPLPSSCIHQQRNYCCPINRCPAIVLVVVWPCASAVWSPNYLFVCVCLCCLKGKTKASLCLFKLASSCRILSILGQIYRYHLGM